MKKLIHSILLRLITNLFHRSGVFSSLEENNWHHVFRESFRVGGWKNELPLAIGRWAGGASFFYVLNRVLEDVQPKKIIELGLGESTKLISTYGLKENWIQEHIVVEHSQDWMHSFLNRFSISDVTNIKLSELEGTSKNSPNTLGLRYSQIPLSLWKNTDLVVIDGPFGSTHNSRSNAVDFVNTLDVTSRFVILLDDTHRDGEKETLVKIQETLRQAGIKHHIGHYGGIKSCSLISSAHYPWLASL